MRDCDKERVACACAHMHTNACTFAVHMHAPVLDPKLGHHCCLFQNASSVFIPSLVIKIT